MLDLYINAKITVQNSDGLIFPSWKWALQSAGGGVLSAAAGMVFDEIVGPSNWERETTEKLNQIIAKLDEILNEIAALRTFITEEGRERWRETLKARICGRIEDIAGHITSARDRGAISADDRIQLHSATASLKEAIGDIAAYSDKSGNPLGMPLYVSVAAAVPILHVAQRLLSISKEILNNDLDRFSATMKQWSSIMEKKAKEMIDQIQPFEAYLTTFPQTGFIAWTSYSGQDYLDSGPTREGHPNYICWGKGSLEGGLNSGFVSTGWEKVEIGSYIEALHQVPDPLWQAASTIFPLIEHSNAQYSTGRADQRLDIGQNGIIKSHAQVEYQLSAMITKLNQKRGEVLQMWRDARQAQGVAQDMLDQAEFFQSLKIA